MAEYFQSNATELTALNTAIAFDSSIPCNKGYVFHENGTGNFILNGKVNNPNCGFARYQVTYNGNISIPTGGAVTPIAVAIVVNGEQRTPSKAVFTPSAVDQLGNVTSTAIITVPRCCCVNVAVEYVDGTVSDPATTPTPTIQVENSNLVISRIA